MTEESGMPNVPWRSDALASIKARSSRQSGPPMAAGALPPVSTMQYASGTSPDPNTRSWNCFYTGKIMSVNYAPDGRHFVTASADGTARVFPATEAASAFRGQILAKLKEPTSPAPLPIARMWDVPRSWQADWELVGVGRHTRKRSVRPLRPWEAIRSSVCRATVRSPGPP